MTGAGVRVRVGAVSSSLSPSFSIIFWKCSGQRSAPRPSTHANSGFMIKLHTEHLIGAACSSIAAAHAASACESCQV